MPPRIYSYLCNMIREGPSLTLHPQPLSLSTLFHGQLAHSLVYRILLWIMGNRTTASLSPTMPISLYLCAVKAGYGACMSWLHFTLHRCWQRCLLSYSRLRRESRTSDCVSLMRQKFNQKEHKDFSWGLSCAQFQMIFGTVIRSMLMHYQNTRTECWVEGARKQIGLFHRSKSVYRRFYSDANSCAQTLQWCNQNAVNTFWYHHRVFA